MRREQKRKEGRVGEGRLENSSPLHHSVSGGKSSCFYVHTLTLSLSYGTTHASIFISSPSDKTIYSDLGIFGEQCYFHPSEIYGEKHTVESRFFLDVWLPFISVCPLARRNPL